MEFNKKLKLLRKTEGYTQKEFAKILGVALSSVGFYEAGGKDPTRKVISKLCNLHPEYTLWLMTGEVQPPHHISPDMKSDTVSADQIAVAKTD